MQQRAELVEACALEDWRWSVSVPLGFSGANVCHGYLLPWPLAPFGTGFGRVNAGARRQATLALFAGRSGVAGPFGVANWVERSPVDWNLESTR